MINEEPIKWDTLPPPLTPDDLCGIGRDWKHVKLRDVPTSFFEYMLKVQREYPRVYRGQQWLRVMEYIKKQPWYRENK